MISKDSTWPPLCGLLFGSRLKWGLAKTFIVVIIENFMSLPTYVIDQTGSMGVSAIGVGSQAKKKLDVSKEGALWGHALFICSLTFFGKNRDSNQKRLQHWLNIQYINIKKCSEKI